MKKYSFRLETVRRVRRTEEKVAKSHLLHANTEVQNAIAIVEQRKDHYEAAVNEPVVATGVDGFMRQRYFNELAGRAVIAARASHAAAVAEAQIKRSAFTAAAQRTKALDRLDEKARELHSLENQRETEKEVDDIVTGRFIKQRQQLN